MTRALYASVTCIFLLTGMLGCGGEQRSGAAPGADTAKVSIADSGSGVVNDTGLRAPTDTAAAADSATRKPDTSTAVAIKPAPRKPRAPRRATPPADTTAAASPSQTPSPTPTTPADTGSTTPPPADTTAAGSAASTGAGSTDTTSSSASQTTTSAPLRDEYHRAPLDTVSQPVYDGWKQYNLNCARCHGEDVQGTTIAPHLLVSVKPDGPINTKEAFMKVVCEGRPAKGMPAWCALGMDMAKIEGVYSYVKGRSEGKIRPGRPALRAGG